jgi:hypothetical protein
LCLFIFFFNATNFLRKNSGRTGMMYRFHKRSQRKTEFLTYVYYCKLIILRHSPSFQYRKNIKYICKCVCTLLIVITKYCICGSQIIRNMKSGDLLTSYLVSEDLIFLSLLFWEKCTVFWNPASVKIIA